MNQSRGIRLVRGGKTLVNRQRDYEKQHRRCEWERATHTSLPSVRRQYYTQAKANAFRGTGCRGRKRGGNGGNRHCHGINYTNNPVNEFYKKGCQEESSAPTGGRGVCLEIQPTVVSLRWRSLADCPCSCVSSADGGDAIEFEKSGKPVRCLRSTMVLSEARGLWLFLVIRGGIACNV